jgi:hypothetical protein
MMRWNATSTVICRRDAPRRPSDGEDRRHNGPVHGKDEEARDDGADGEEDGAQGVADDSDLLVHARDRNPEMGHAADERPLTVACPQSL